MLKHTQLGDSPYQRSRKLKSLLLSGEVNYAGNSKLKIYGLLSCSSGKRMKYENRVFFSSDKEAEQLGYRPCSHCMRKAYLQWKVAQNLQ